MRCKSGGIILTDIVVYNGYAFKFVLTFLYLRYRIDGYIVRNCKQCCLRQTARLRSVSDTHDTSLLVLAVNVADFIYLLVCLHYLVGRHIFFYTLAKM